MTSPSGSPMAQRPFNPDALKPHATSWLQPNVCNWSSVWRYTVFVPVEHIRDDGTVQPIATPDDLNNLELTLITHLGGITVLPLLSNPIGSVHSSCNPPDKLLS